MGSRKIWRIEPTGQLYDCHATVLGEDADQAEVELYRRLLEECKKERDMRGEWVDVRELLDSMSQDQALIFAEDFLQSRLSKQQLPVLQTPRKPSQSTTKLMSSHSPSHVFWQAIIQDYSSLTKRGGPRTTLKRGAFVPRS